LRSARETREHTSAVFKLIANKSLDREDFGHVLVDLLDIFNDVFGSYVRLHEILRPCAEVAGVDLRTFVAKAADRRAKDMQVPSEAAREFGRILRELRVSVGLGSEEVAVRAGLDVYRYREIDGGLSEPNILELFSIATALETPPSELVRRFESQLHEVMRGRPASTP
jgi:hypothetical protein